MNFWSNIGTWMHQIGHRQVPVWFDTSESIISEFQTIGKKLKILKIFPNPFLSRQSVALCARVTGSGLD